MRILIPADEIVGKADEMWSRSSYLDPPNRFDTERRVKLFRCGALTLTSQQQETSNLGQEEDARQISETANGEKLKFLSGKLISIIINNK